MLEEAAGFVAALRPEGQPRQAISVSFRAVPGLLTFVNDLFDDIAKSTDSRRRDAFRYSAIDQFPIEQDVSLKADATHHHGSVRLQPDGSNAVQFLAASTIESEVCALTRDLDSIRALALMIRP